MKRERASASLHERIGQAIARGTDINEASHAVVAETQAATAALARTVAEVHRCRDRRRFGNGHIDDQDPEGAG